MRCFSILVNVLSDIMAAGPMIVIENMAEPINPKSNTLKNNTKSPIELATQINICDIGILGALASFSANTFFLGIIPMPSPAGVTMYLFLSNSKDIIETIIPIQAAKNPHLKSPAFPVSPNPPHTNGAKKAPKLIPM